MSLIFFFEHAAISRISILDDWQNYTADCNSVRSQKGFRLALTRDMGEKEKPLLSFILTAAMQAAFLSAAASEQLLGYDFTKPADRAAHIEKLVALLFKGARRESSL